MQFLYSKKYQMNTLDESLIHPSIAVVHLVASICVQMWDNLADILQNLAAKAGQKLVAMRCVTR